MTLLLGDRSWTLAEIHASHEIKIVLLIAGTALAKLFQALVANVLMVPEAGHGTGGDGRG